MTKYIIMWNSGYGDSFETVEAESDDDAQQMAYEQWMEEAQQNADYWAKEYTPKLGVKYLDEDETESESED